MYLFHVCANHNDANNETDCAQFQWCTLNIFHRMWNFHTKYYPSKLFDSTFKSNVIWIYISILRENLAKWNPRLLKVLSLYKWIARSIPHWKMANRTHHHPNVVHTYGVWENGNPAHHHHTHTLTHIETDSRLGIRFACVCSYHWLCVGKRVSERASSVWFCCYGTSEGECASKELPLIFGCRLFFSPFCQQCLENVHFFFLSIRFDRRNLLLAFAIIRCCWVFF